MSRLERVTHKLFAENAPVVESGTTQVEIGQFGSALAGTYVATNDVATLQALPAYTRGWGGAVISENNFPTLEDMNAVQRVQSYQTGYLYQEGIPEYDANTTYYKGSVCKIYQDGSTSIATSLIDENTGNPLTDPNSWSISPLIAGNVLRYNQITNCLLEVPQNIKLELNNGTLTLKAGSTPIFPNGDDVFEYKTTTNDIVIAPTGGSSQVLITIKYDLTSGQASTNSYSGDNVTPTAYSICYDTATNLVFRYSADTTAGVKSSLPVAICTQTDGVITSIDQVFNGMGYIGSTLWVGKGVKGLIPNGRNEDGTLKNIEFTFNTVSTRTFSSSDNYTGAFVAINPNISPAISRSRAEAYAFDANNNYNLVLGTPWINCVIGTLDETNGVISNFQPKLPFRAVDYNDFASTPRIIQTYENGTSGYEVYSNGKCRQWGRMSAGQNISVTYLKEYINQDYTLSYSPVNTTNNDLWVSDFCIHSFDETGFVASNQGGTTAFWQAYGYIN